MKMHHKAMRYYGNIYALANPSSMFLRTRPMCTIPNAKVHLLWTTIQSEYSRRDDLRRYRRRY